MTELLERALDEVRRQPPDVQDQVAEAMLRLVRDEESETPEPLDPAHREAVLEGFAQAHRGEFISDEALASIFGSFDR